MRQTAIGLASILLITGWSVASVGADDVPDPADVKIVKILEVPAYCEGVVFDHEGYGYISWGDTITQFTPDGKHQAWAVTGAPNGHKVLADGTHLVCDAGQHAVLHLSSEGKIIGAAAWHCQGKQLRGPNDLTLDPQGGFYFTDPYDSGVDNPIGTVHFVDPAGKTHLIDEGLAYPNGIVLRPDGKQLLVAESQKNRILAYKVTAPGKVGPHTLFADLPRKDQTAGQIDHQPDGICLDEAGNLYVAHYGMKQVQVLDLHGKLMARYPGGNLTASNVAFGGQDWGTLYITGGLLAESGGGGLFRIDLGVKGLVILPPKNP